MRQHFRTFQAFTEQRLVRFRSFENQGDSFERQRQQQQREQIQQYLETGGVPNAMNQRMNVTGERLGKSRSQLLQELSQQYRYLTQLIDTMRTYFKRNSQYQRNNVRGAMAISPRFGGGMGPLGFERRLEAQGAANRMQMQFGDLQSLEIQRDQIRFQMAQLHAENVAGLPDNVSPTADAMQGTPQVQPARFFNPGSGPAPAVQMGGGAPEFQQRSAAAEVRTLGAEEQKMIDGLPIELQEPAARLYEMTPEASRAGLFSLAGKLGAESADVLRKFFSACFSPEGILLAPADVKIDEGDADGERAKALLEGLTPEERAAAEGLLAQAKEFAARNAPKKFEDLDASTKSRILKYAKKWNEASDPPDSPDREIAEGMLYLDGVDVEGSVKGKTIEEKNIKMLDKNGRIFGLLAGLIKIAHGFKRKFGETARGSEKPGELPKPSEMTAAERSTEIAENTKKIAELRDRQDNILPKEIERLKKEIEGTKPEDTEALNKLKANLKAAEDELAAIPDKIKELEARNEALAAAVKEEEIPESERFARKKCQERIESIGTKYGVLVAVPTDPTIDYDRSLVVLEKIEAKLATLTEDQLTVLRNARPADAETGRSVFEKERVTISLNGDDGEAVTLMETTMEEIKNDTESVDADPRIRFRIALEKVKEKLRADFEEYIRQLETNPLMKGMAERLGVNMDSPRFQEALAREKPKVIAFMEDLVDAASLERGEGDNYRLSFDLSAFVRAMNKIVDEPTVLSAQTRLIDELQKSMEMTREGGALVSEWKTLAELEAEDLAKVIMEGTAPAEAETPAPVEAPTPAASPEVKPAESAAPAEAETPAPVEAPTPAASPEVKPAEPAAPTENPASPERLTALATRLGLKSLTVGGEENLSVAKQKMSEIEGALTAKKEILAGKDVELSSTSLILGGGSKLSLAIDADTTQATLEAQIDGLLKENEIFDALNLELSTLGTSLGLRSLGIDHHWNAAIVATKKKEIQGALTAKKEILAGKDVELSSTSLILGGGSKLSLAIDADTTQATLEAQIDGLLKGETPAEPPASEGSGNPAPAENPETAESSAPVEAEKPRTPEDLARRVTEFKQTTGVTLTIGNDITDTAKAEGMVNALTKAFNEFNESQKTTLREKGILLTDRGNSGYLYGTFEISASMSPDDVERKLRDAMRDVRQADQMQNGVDEVANTFGVKIVVGQLANVTFAPSVIAKQVQEALGELTPDELVILRKTSLEITNRNSFNGNVCIDASNDWLTPMTDKIRAQLPSVEPTLALRAKAAAFEEATGVRIRTTKADSAAFAESVDTLTGIVQALPVEDQQTLRASQIELTASSVSEYQNNVFLISIKGDIHATLTRLLKQAPEVRQIETWLESAKQKAAADLSASYQAKLDTVFADPAFLEEMKGLGIKADQIATLKTYCSTHQGDIEKAVHDVIDSTLFSQRDGKYVLWTFVSPTFGDGVGGVTRSESQRIGLAVIRTLMGGKMAYDGDEKEQFFYTLSSEPMTAEELMKVSLIR